MDWATVAEYVSIGDALDEFVGTQEGLKPQAQVVRERLQAPTPPGCAAAQGLRLSDTPYS